MASGERAARCESRVASKARPGQERLGRVSLRANMSEREARLRRRRISRLRSLAADPRFQRAVLHVRTLTGLSPKERRDFGEAWLRDMALWYGARADLTLPQYSFPQSVLDRCTEAAFGTHPRYTGWLPIQSPNTGWPPPQSPTLEGFSKTEEVTLADELRQLRAASLKTCKEALADELRQLRAAGLKVSPYTLETAVFTDYDGAEFDLWAEASVKAPAFPPMIACMSASAWETIKSLPLETVIKPKRIYIDVTDLDIPQLEEYWPSIEMLQLWLRAKPPSLKRGRPVGIPTRRKTVLGETWEEIRTVIRQDPSYHTRWETKYIKAEASRKEQGWLAQNPHVTKAPDSLKHRWRRQAKDNFYHQVIVHPSMRDLNLRPRQKGRRRKN